VLHSLPRFRCVLLSLCSAFLCIREMFASYFRHYAFLACLIPGYSRFTADLTRAFSAGDPC
jgi:hypothetical protein